MAPLGNRASGPTVANTWRPDFVDVREDRVVFYGTVGTEAQTFSYRLKPTNRGLFKVPPLYAEGMYDRRVQARSLGGQFRVGDLTGAATHVREQLAVAQCIFECVYQGLGRRLDEPPVVAINDDIGRAANRTHDDGQSTCERLDRGDAEAFGL